MANSTNADPITDFHGDFAFLSNFYPCPVRIDLVEKGSFIKSPARKPLLSGMGRKRRLLLFLIY